MKKEYSDLLDKHRNHVLEFKAFCLGGGQDDAFEEINFRDLSIGFFIARGITGDGGTGEAFYEAFVLASICRYTLQYFDGTGEKWP